MTQARREARSYLGVVTVYERKRQMVRCTANLAALLHGRRQVRIRRPRTRPPTEDHATSSLPTDERGPHLHNEAPRRNRQVGGSTSSGQNGAGRDSPIARLAARRPNRCKQRPLTPGPRKRRAGPPGLISISTPSPARRRDGQAGASRAQVILRNPCGPSLRRLVWPLQVEADS